MNKNSKLTMLLLIGFAISIIAGCGGDGGPLTFNVNNDPGASLTSARNLSIGGQVLVATVAVPPAPAPAQNLMVNPQAAPVYLPLANAIITLLGKTTKTDANGYYVIHLMEHEAKLFNDGDSSIQQINENTVGNVKAQVKIKKSATTLLKVKIKIEAPGKLYPDDPIEVQEAAVVALIPEEIAAKEIEQLTTLITNNIDNKEGQAGQDDQGQTLGQISGWFNKEGVTVKLGDTVVSTTKSDTVPYLEVSATADADGQYAFIIHNLQPATVVFEVSKNGFNSYRREMVTGPGIINSNIQAFLKDLATVTGMTLAVVSGDNQAVAAGAAVADSLVIKVLDGNQTGVKGVTVTFTVATGNGTIDTNSTQDGIQTTVLTDFQGKAVCEKWTTGIVPGAQTVTATAVGTTPTSVTFTANSTDQTAPTLTFPIATVQTLKSGDVSTSTLQMNEAGKIYLVKNGEAATTQTEIDAAITANKGFLAKDAAIADTAYTATVPAGLLDGTYDGIAIDAAGNISAIVPGWLIIDNTAPVVSAPTAVAQVLASADVSTSTIQMNEAGKIYFVKNGEVATTQAEIDAAVTATKGFLAKDAAVADTAYPVTVANGLTNGVYDLVGVDNAGNISAIVAGWLTIDNVVLVASAPTSTPQSLKSGDVSASTVQMNKAGKIYLVKNGEAATTQVEIDAALTANKGFLAKDSAVADMAYTVTIPAGLVDGVYDIVAVDENGKISAITAGWLTADNTAPVVSAPTSDAQALAGGAVSTSTIQMNEAGKIYLVKNGEAATTQAEIDAAITANKGFMGKDGAVADTAYPVTVAAGLTDGVYDLVGVDTAGNISAIVAGWLTVENIVLTASAPTNAAQALKFEAVSTSTVAMNKAGKIYLVKNGEAATTQTEIDAAITDEKGMLVKDGAVADTAYPVTMPESGLVDGVYDIVAVDTNGNVSAITPGWLTADNTAPVITGNNDAGQIAKEGNSGNLATQINETGHIFMVKNGLAITTAADIQTAITNNQAFIVKEDSPADTDQYARVPSGPEDALYDLIGTDMAGNLSNRVTGWLTVDNTKPVVSAPISAAQTLKYEDTSTSNMQMNEDGFLYAVKNGEAVDTTQAIVAAWQNSKGIQVKSGSTADTPYFITLPENGLEDGVYDLVGYDRAGNVADAIAGWLTVDNTKPIVSAATATAQTLKYEDTSTSTMQMNEAGTLWLVLTGETANSEATITTAYGANKAIRVKTSADADTAYVVNMPEDNLTDGVYDLVGVDNAGNVSDIVPGWLTVDNTPPVVTASSNTGVRVKEGNTSSLTMQINEVGTLYLVKNGLAINSPSDLQTAITNNQAFIAAADVAADTAQYARVPAGLEEALYDVIGVDKAGLLSNRVIGWLTADNTKPVVSAPISAAQTLKFEAVSTSNVQSTEAGFLYLVKNGETADTTGAIVAAWQAGKGIQVKTSAVADSPYTVTIPESGLEDGVYDLVGWDMAGNVSDVVPGWLTVDNTPPTASAPTSAAQTLAPGATSTSTVQSNEAGKIYLILNGETYNTQSAIDTAIAADKAWLAKDGAVADSPYMVTVPATITDGVYDIVAIDAAGNISTSVGGWLTGANAVTTNVGVGMNGQITGMVSDSNGNVYVAGWFTQAATGVAANRIAKWDGSNWSALSTGFTGNTSVSPAPMAVDSNNNLYVGAVSISGLSGNIYKWDGNAWSALGVGLNGTVQKIVIDSSNNVYAFGSFTTAGGSAAWYAAKWDGANWSPMGVDLGLNAKPYYATIDPTNDDIYVSGQCTATKGNGTIFGSKMAKWDGSAWTGFAATTTYQGGLFIDSSGNFYAGYNNAGTKGIYKYNGAGDFDLLGESGKSTYAFTEDASGNVWAAGAYTGGFVKVTAGGTSNPSGYVEGSWAYGITSTPDGTIYIGGNQTNVNNEADADYIYRYQP